MSKDISEKVTFWDQKRKHKLFFYQNGWIHLVHLQYLYSNIEAFQTSLECWGKKTQKSG